jgi:hypothetical protein
VALQQFDESHNSAFLLGSIPRCKASECVDTVNRKITDHGRGDELDDVRSKRN